MDEQLDIKILKLVTGEEIIGQIGEGSREGIRLSQVFMLGIDQQAGRLVFAPFMAYTNEGKNGTVTFKFEHVICVVTPVESLCNDYLHTLEELGMREGKPKIFMPGKKPLLTPVN